MPQPMGQHRGGGDSPTNGDKNERGMDGSGVSVLVGRRAQNPQGRARDSYWDGGEDGRGRGRWGVNTPTNRRLGPGTPGRVLGTQRHKGGRTDGDGEGGDGGRHN